MKRLVLALALCASFGTQAAPDNDRSPLNGGSTIHDPQQQQEATL